jgi:LysM repeat protein
MNSYRQVTLGILAVLLSIAIVFGSLMMGFVEGGLRMPVPAGETLLASVFVTPTPSPMPGTPTAIPVSDTPLPSVSPSITMTPFCIPPDGWTAITIQLGDTLASLAQTYDTTIKKLKAANCLLTNDLIPDTLFYVPVPEPTSTVPTATVYQCGPPYGWVFYTVQAGDTLYSIADLFDTTVYALQNANCMAGSTLIRIGQQLSVPYHATSTPGTTPTPSETVQPTSTEPPFQDTPTGTPSQDTPTETPSQDTPTPTPMPTFPDPTLLPTPAITPLPTIGPNPTLIVPVPY